jgi:hypothetical protein
MLRMWGGRTLTIMQVLWELEGASIERKTLMRRAGVALEKPVDAFARNKYPGANRVYRTLVSSDRTSHYRLERYITPLV